MDAVDAVRVFVFALPQGIAEALPLLIPLLVARLIVYGLHRERRTSPAISRLDRTLAALPPPAFGAATTGHEERRPAAEDTRFPSR